MCTDIEISKELIIRFLNSKYLNGDISKLSHFSFSKLENDSIFGSPGRTFDQDDTNLARAIMYTIWFQKLPDLSLSQIGPGKKYRGDTINTYNTLFGKYDQHKKYSNDHHFIELVSKFKEIYVTIGNFMLMPNNSAKDPYNLKSINCYRGISSGWYDYFDKFLYELDKCLDPNPYNHDKRLNFLIKENLFYFKQIDTIFEFCRINYLDSYIHNKRVTLLFNPYLYHWKYKSISRDAISTYMNFSYNYINQVIEIINKRSVIMINVLKQALSN
jgi:hypothetical protein